jgi:hypothetical protein
VNVTKPLSDKQFVIMYQRHREFSDAVTEMDGMERPEEIDPVLWKAQRDALTAVRDEFQLALDAYASDQVPLIQREPS